MTATKLMTNWVAGVDEVGRGPLAGPVVAAAVVLQAQTIPAGLADSKQLSPTRRVRMSREIKRAAVCFGLGLATVEEIDELNILQASLLAMERAVARLQGIPAKVLVDGHRAPSFDWLPGTVEVIPVIRGDQTEPAISAASIVGKVARDRLLCRLHRSYPQYDLQTNKGYPTRVHLDALNRYGVSPLHRRTFGPVRRVLAGETA